MMPDAAPAMRLIDVDVESDGSGLLIATSRQLPKLLVVATCNEELARDLPELICDACEARFGERCKVFAVNSAGTWNGVWRCERWALVPD